MGMTRAKDELMLATYGDYRAMFVDEATKPKHKPATRRTSGTRTSDTQYSRIKKNQKKSVTPTPAADIKPGVIVEHKDFGTGRVISIYNDKISIDFGGKGKKTFLLSLVLKNGYIRSVKQ